MQDKFSGRIFSNHCDFPKIPIWQKRAFDLRFILDCDNSSWLGITLIAFVDLFIRFSTIWIPFSSAVFPVPLAYSTCYIQAGCFNVGRQWVISKVLFFKLRARSNSSSCLENSYCLILLMNPLPFQNLWNYFCNF